MEGGPPTFRQDFSCPALLKSQPAILPVRGYHPLWRDFPDASGSYELGTGLVRVRSPLLAESRLISFPPATEMFQFAGFASRTYGFSSGYPIRGGFPHSDMPGSKIAPISPGLFAGCHVLHRLLPPRHPPDALKLLHSSWQKQTRPKTGRSCLSSSDRFSAIAQERSDFRHSVSIGSKPTDTSLFTMSNS